MFFRTFLHRNIVAVTDDVAAHSAGSRYLHKPGEALSHRRKHRLRERIGQRRRNIASKEAEVKRSVEQVTSSRDLILAQLADTIFSKGHRHVASATNVTFVPDGNPAMPLVALAGRERCGKTSLLRSLFRSAREVSRANRQLRRDAMNFFNVGGVFNVADLPGCGGTSVPWTAILQHAVLLRNFARCQPSLKMLYYCMDVHYKHGVYIQDIDLLRFLTREIPNFTIVLTKADQVSDTSRTSVHLEDIRKELLYNDIPHPMLVTSAFHMGGTDALRYDMVMNCVHSLPTERLTLTEAQRLSTRLFTQRELSTIRQLAIAPSEAEDEARAWTQQAHLEQDAALQKSDVFPVLCEPPIKQDETEHLHTVPELPRETARGRMLKVSAPAHVTKTAEELASSSAGSEAHTGIQRGFSGGASQVPIVFQDPITQAAYQRVVKTLHNQPLQQYINATSPWRNPLRWPSHVVPTKHPKANIMRCPGASGNPFLFQAQYVAPRADMCFRRPNVGARRSSQKGKYEADRPLAFLVKQYTVPYFPDIVDTAMQPTPWAFVGSREAYHERNGGRRLGVRLLNYATQGMLNPLADNPAPQHPHLTRELHSLEGKVYRAPIATLRPPEVAPMPIPMAPSQPILNP